MGRAVAWTEERFKAFCEDHDKAKAEGRTTFIVEIKGQGTYDFDMRYANEVREHLAVEFARPQPVYPPNLEGKEGQ